MKEVPEEMIEEPKEPSIGERFKQYLPVNADFKEEFITSPVEGYVVSTGRISHNGELFFKKNNRNTKLEALIGAHAGEFHDGCYVAFHISPEKPFWVTPYDGKFIHTQENNRESDSALILQIEKTLDYVHMLPRELFARALRKNISIGSIYETKHFPIAMVIISSSSTNGINLQYTEGKEYKKASPVGYFNEGLGMLLCFPGNQKIIPNKKEKVTMGQELVLLGQD